MYFMQRKQNISDYPVRWGPRKLPAARQRLLEQAAQQAEVEQGWQLETWDSWDGTLKATWKMLEMYSFLESIVALDVFGCFYA